MLSPSASFPQGCEAGHPLQPRHVAAVVTDLVVTDPVITNPVITDPVITDPVITDPLVTDLVVTDPALLRRTSPSRPRARLRARLGSPCGSGG
jgi:hypothetical protein